MAKINFSDYLEIYQEAKKAPQKYKMYMEDINDLTSIYVQKIEFIVEGKQQVLRYLIANGISPQESKEYFQQLADLDPTSPKNKYIEFFAKMIINKQTTIQEIQEFVEQIKKFELKSKIIDLTTISDWDTFKTKIESGVAEISRSDMKRGLQGLIEGTHYIDFGQLIGQKNGVVYDCYIPLTHKASKTIASPAVGQPMRTFRAIKQNKPEAQWCISTNSEDGWILYTKRRKKTFVMAIAKDDIYDKPEAKIALELINKDDNFVISNEWDADDVSHPAGTFFGLDI